MSFPFNSDAFKRLKAQWYSKLAKSGFEDIERNENELILWHSEYFLGDRRHATAVVEGKINYYRIAGQFLHDHAFNNAHEKEMWRLHAEGKSIRDIMKVLKKFSKRKVHTVLTTLEAEMINRWKRKPV